MPNFTANFTSFLYRPPAPSQKCKGIPVGTGSSRAQWTYSLKQCHCPVHPPHLTRSLATPYIQGILILSFLSEGSPSKYQTAATPPFMRQFHLSSRNLDSSCTSFCIPSLAFLKFSVHVLHTEVSNLHEYFHMYLHMSTENVACIELMTKLKYSIQNKNGSSQKTTAFMPE